MCFPRFHIFLAFGSSAGGGSLGLGLRLDLHHVRHDIVLILIEHLLVQLDLLLLLLGLLLLLLHVPLQELGDGENDCAADPHDVALAVVSGEQDIAAGRHDAALELVRVLSAQDTLVVRLADLGVDLVDAARRRLAVDELLVPAGVDAGVGRVEPVELVAPGEMLRVAVVGADRDPQLGVLEGVGLAVDVGGVPLDAQDAVLRCTHVRQPEARGCARRHLADLGQVVRNTLDVVGAIGEDGVEADSALDGHAGRDVRLGPVDEETQGAGDVVVAGPAVDGESDVRHCISVHLRALAAVQPERACDPEVNLQHTVLQVLLRPAGVRGEALAALDGELDVEEAAAAAIGDTDGEVVEGALIAGRDEHVFFDGPPAC